MEPMPTARSARVQSLLGLLAALVLLGFAPPSTATAALPGPGTFSLGFADDSMFRDSSEPVRSFWYRRAQALGSDSVRIGIVWSVVAPYRLPHGFHAANPADPHYNWSSLDAAVRDASADGQSVVLLLAHAPLWAEGHGRPSWAPVGSWLPSPRALGSFARAVALRYSGHFRDPLHHGRLLPLVSHFQAWNEPNLPTYLTPQWVNVNGTVTAASPEIYRTLLNTVYAAVKSVQPHSFVLAAGTAPYGDPPGVGRMQPTDFLRGLLCLTAQLRSQACPDPAHFDALDHHPYSLTATAHARAPGNVSVPDLGKIWRILRAAERFHTALPAGPKSLWVTEIGWSANPPAPSQLARQAHNLSLGFYELWTQHVSHVYWFLLRDPPQNRKSFSGGGLYLKDGAAKPAAAAFRFPFIAVRAAHGRLTLWGKSPVAGPIVIERQVGHQWRPVLQLTSTAGGIFYGQARLALHTVLRARAGADVSPVWIAGRHWGQGE